jgi:hypothetical protein
MLSNVGLPSMGWISDDGLPEHGQRYEFKLTRQGGEIIDVIYRVGDTYISEALDNLSQFLPDSHNDEVKSYDTRTFDVLHTTLRKLNRSSSVIEIPVATGQRRRTSHSAVVEPPTQLSAPSTSARMRSISGFQEFQRWSCGTPRFHSARVA